MQHLYLLYASDTIMSVQTGSDAKEFLGVLLIAPAFASVELDA